MTWILRNWEVQSFTLELADLSLNPIQNLTIFAVFHRSVYFFHLRLISVSFGLYAWFHSVSLWRVGASGHYATNGWAGAVAKTSAQRQTTVPEIVSECLNTNKKLEVKILTVSPLLTSAVHNTTQHNNSMISFPSPFSNDIRFLRSRNFVVEGSTRFAIHSKSSRNIKGWLMINNYSPKLR